MLPAIREICASIESDVEVVPRSGMMPFNFESKVYLLENLGCANCAAKMEKAINDLPDVSAATITYATKQLRLTAKNHAQLLPQVQAICSTIEAGVKVVERIGKPVLAENINQRKKSGGILSMSDEQRSLAEIVFGGILFIISEITGLVPEAYHIYCLVAAYILLGGRIVLTALKNSTKGQVFDENFLMTVATLGAFAINQYEEAVGVMLFYRIGEYFEHRAVEKSRGQIMEAVDMRPEVVNLLIGEDVRVIPAEEANVGDILLVRAGDRIPLDGVVIEGESLLDTSPVTGEPVPVKRSFGDEVISGCINTSGMLKIRVEKVLAESMVTKILDSVENAAASKPQLDRFITRFARIYTPFVVAVAVLTAVIPGFITGNWEYWTYTALTFLVISCPCALVISIPLSFFAGIGGASAEGVLVKGSNYLEALAGTRTVVFDKTGTITQGVFEVCGIHGTNCASGSCPVVSGHPVYTKKEEQLLEYAALAECHSTHPISISLQKAYGKKLDVDRVTDVQEIGGHGVIATVDGHRVAAGNDKLMKKEKIAYRNCSCTGTIVHLAVDGVYAGHILISDMLKPNAAAAMQALKNSGVHRLVMLTGDDDRVAQQVAGEVGITEVHSQLLPADKVSEVEKLLQTREEKSTVAFVGDGINDAPVLSRVDVGIAMGALGSDAAIEAADVVLMDDDPLKIAKAIRIARKCLRIVYENICFAIGIKLLCLFLVTIGIANMWMGIFADVGVMVIAVLNAIRALFVKKL